MSLLLLRNLDHSGRVLRFTAVNAVCMIGEHCMICRTAILS